MLQITTQNFQKEVLQSKMPVIVDFWAEWCQPCKLLGPIFEAVSNDFAGRMQFAKLNVEEHPQLAAQYEVMGIPCMILFRNGEEVDRIVGLQSKEALVKKLTSSLSP